MPSPATTFDVLVRLKAEGIDIIAQLREELNSVMSKLSSLPAVAAGAMDALKQIDADAAAGAAALKDTAAAAESVVKSQTDLANAVNEAADAAATATSANAAQAGSLDNLTTAAETAAGGASALDAAASGAAASVESIQPAASQAQGGMSGFREEMRQASERTKAFNKEALNGGAALQQLAQYAAAFIGWRTIREGMSAAEESVRATNQLDRALANMGETSQEARSRLLDQAEALQDVTGISDEATIAVQSMLLTLGSTAQETEQLTPLVLDMAAAMGMDQHSAATLVAKAMAGAGEELSRYGIEIDKSKPRIEAMTEALRRFQGAAKQDVAYPALTRLKSIVGDIVENAGKHGMSYAERFFKGMSDKLAELREKQQQEQAEGPGWFGRNATAPALESAGSRVGANAELLTGAATMLIAVIALKKAWEQVRVVVDGLFMVLTGSKAMEWLRNAQIASKEYGVWVSRMDTFLVQGNRARNLMRLIGAGAGIAGGILAGWNIGKLISEFKIADRTISDWLSLGAANTIDFFHGEAFTGEYGNRIRGILDSKERLAEAERNHQTHAEQVNRVIERQAQDMADLTQRMEKYNEAVARFLSAKTEAGQINETTGGRADRLVREADAADAKARSMSEAGPQNGQTNTEWQSSILSEQAIAQEKRNEAERIFNGLLAQGTEITFSEIDAFMRTRDLLEQRSFVEKSLAEARSAEMSSSVDSGDADYGAQLETQNARRQRILDLESRLREIKDQQLSQLDQEWQTQSAFYTERIANLDTEIEKLRAQNTPEAVAASTRLEATKLEYWQKLNSLANTFNQKASDAGATPVVQPDGSVKPRYEAPKDDSTKQPAPTRYEQTRRNFAGLSDNTQHLQTFDEGFGSGIMDSLTRMGTVADQVGQSISNSMSTAMQGFGDSVGRSIVYAEDLGDAMKNVGATIISSVISSGVQMLAQQALYRAAEIAGFGEAEAAKVEIATSGAVAREGLMAVETGVDAANQEVQVGVHAVGEEQKTGISLLGRIRRGAIWLAETIFHAAQWAWRIATHLFGETTCTASTQVNAGSRLLSTISESIAYVIKSAVQAASAVASIPYVGPALAVVAMGAMLGAGMALVGQIGKGFQDGTPYSWTGDGPEDQVAGVVHNREVVVAAPRVRALGGPAGVERALSGRMVAANPSSSTSSGRARGGDQSAEVTFLGYRTPNERRDAIERTRGRVDDIDKRLRRAGI